jgi:hypothetical protein
MLELSAARLRRAPKNAQAPPLRTSPAEASPDAAADKPPGPRRRRSKRHEAHGRLGVVPSGCAGEASQCGSQGGGQLGRVSPVSSGVFHTSGQLQGKWDVSEWRLYGCETSRAALASASFASKATRGQTRTPVPTRHLGSRGRSAKDHSDVRVAVLARRRDPRRDAGGTSACRGFPFNELRDKTCPCLTSDRHS